MATLTDHPALSIVRMLNVAGSGGGKTGALASLAKAGYNLYILDYDNGLDILVNLLRGDQGALARVHYETLKDEVIFSGKGVPRVKPPPTAFSRAGEVLTSWKPETWTSQDILVLDTLSTFSAASFHYWLHMSGRLNQRPQIQDYGAMADSVLLFIDAITGPEMKCNVIVNTHIRYLGGDDDDNLTLRGLPDAKGQQIPKDVGKFFNTTILTRTKGSGPSTRRVISTKPQGIVEVKVSNPIGVEDEYPIETGLAALFKDILGSSPRNGDAAK